LRRRPRQDAQNAMTRRLRLGCDDADLLAQQSVEQRRLADVRSADDRREATPIRRCAGFVCGRHGLSWSAGGWIRSSMSWAAACSARLRLAPLACVLSPSASTEQLT